MKWIITVLLIATFPLQAAITPKAQSFDPRITLTKYNPEDVIRVRTHVGITTLIQFEEGENILARMRVWELVTLMLGASMFAAITFF